MSELNEMKKWVECSPKWERDFDRFLSTYRTFLVHGFVNDLQPLPQSYAADNDYMTSSLFNYFDEVYTAKLSDRQEYGLAEQEQDYCVIGYDPTLAEGQRFVFFDKTNLDAVSWTGDSELDGTDVAPQDNSEQSEQQKPPNPFKGRDNEKAKFWAFINNEKAEEILPAGHGPGGMSLDFSRMHLALSGALKNKKPYMFVVLASRMSMTPGNVSNAEENQTFAVISLLTNALDTTVDNEENPNRLVVVADKSNDIPAWLSSEQYNHTIKKLHVSKPDSEDRQYYFDNMFQLIRPMSRHKIIDSEKLARVIDPLRGPENDAEKEFMSIRRNYVNKTDGFSLREMAHLTEYVRSEPDGDAKNITSENVALKIASFKSGVSVNPWTKPDTIDKIRQLEIECGKVIIGQDRVLKAAANIMQLAVTETNRVFTPSAPRAVLFLAGPTGTGKTELAKQLTELVFGNQDRMKRFDMSEFRADHTEARLFGAPPGYVGHEAGGELTEYVKRFPFSLILFDEIEKACSSIMDKFLQILSDGRLTDGQGETVDFSNTIIVMTSNAGIKDPRETGANAGQNGAELMTPVTIDDMRQMEQNYINKMTNSDAVVAESNSESNDVTEPVLENVMPYADAQGQPIDYINMEFSQDDYKNLDDKVNQQLNKNLEKHFSDVLGRPELYGRLKESIIAYNFITAGSARDIALKYVDKVNTFMLEKYRAEIQMEEGKPKTMDEVKNFVARACMNPQVRVFGARGVIEHVKTIYAGSLSEFIIKEKNIRDRKIKASLKDSKIDWSLV